MPYVDMDSGTVIGGPLRFVKDWDTFPDDPSDVQAREIGASHGVAVDTPPTRTQVCGRCRSTDVEWLGRQDANTGHFTADEGGGWCNTCAAATHIVDRADIAPEQARVLESLRRAGFAVTVFGPDELGSIEPDTLEALLAERGNETVAELRLARGLHDCQVCAREYPSTPGGGCSECGTCWECCEHSAEWPTDAKES